jgi:hypothetical protein
MTAIVHSIDRIHGYTCKQRTMHFYRGQKKPLNYCIYRTYTVENMLAYQCISIYLIRNEVLGQYPTICGR